jgi:hypothetical protein
MTLVAVLRIHWKWWSEGFCSCPEPSVRPGLWVLTEGGRRDSKQTDCKEGQRPVRQQAMALLLEIEPRNNKTLFPNYYQQDIINTRAQPGWKNVNYSKIRCRNLHQAGRFCGSQPERTLNASILIRAEIISFLKKSEWLLCKAWQITTQRGLFPGAPSV